MSEVEGIEIGFPGGIALILAVITFLVVRYVVRRYHKRTDTTRGRLAGISAFVVGCTLVLAVLIAASMLAGVGTLTVHIEDDQSSADETGFAAEHTDISSIDLPAERPLPESPDDHSRGDAIEVELPNESETIVTDSEDTLWFPITSETLEELLGPENAATVAQIQERVPPDLQRAYAMIPLSADGPKSAPPVIRRVLSPAAIRHILTPDNIQTAVDTLSEYLLAGRPQSDASPQTDVAKEQQNSKGDTALADQQAEEHDKRAEAAWIENPGIGQVVVHSRFADASIAPEVALRPAIVEALTKHMTKLASAKFGPVDGWTGLIDLSLSDPAITNCIVTTDAGVQYIDANGVRKKMQETYALLQFPESTESQILAAIRNAVTRQRTAALCVTVGCFWLSAVLLAIVVRLGRRPAVMGKVVAVAVTALAILPGLAVGTILLIVMARGEITRLPLADERLACVVDVAPE